MVDMRFSKGNDVLGTTNRGNAAESSLCTLCRADCQGKCEPWMSSLVGRKLLYPRGFGMVTAGANNTTHVGVSYNSLRIQGYAYGAHGLAKGLSNGVISRLKVWSGPPAGSWTSTGSNACAGCTFAISLSRSSMISSARRSVPAVPSFPVPAKRLILALMVA